MPCGRVRIVLIEMQSEIVGAGKRPIMCLAIGYPDPEGMVANSTKKSLSQLRRYNFE